MATEVRPGSSTALEEAVGNAAAGAPKPGKTLQDEIRALTPQLKAALPSNTVDADRFVRVILTELRKTPRLLNCTRESFLGAMMQVAQLGLEVGNTLGQAYLIPYKQECTLQIGYKGLIELAYRGGILMEAREIRENDDFVFDYGSERPLQRHAWKVGNPRGEIIGYYATASLPDGRQKLLVMDESEIEARRLRSRAKDDGPWKTDRAAMSRKTLVRALAPQVPMSTELSEAIRVDEATITRDTSGELKLSYSDSIDVKEVGSGTQTARDGLTNLINMVEPNAQRLDCSRYLLNRFGNIENLDGEDLIEAMEIVREWPESKSATPAPQADRATGEILDVESHDLPATTVGEPSQSVVDEVLAGLPNETREAAMEALQTCFGDDYDPNSEEVQTFLAECLDVRIDEEPVEQQSLLESSDSEPVANMPDLPGGGSVPDDLLAQTKKMISFWDKETCDRVLLQFGMPRTGSLESKRLRLVTTLAPLRHLGDPSATDLF